MPYRRLLRLVTSHVIPSTTQLAHGVPDSVTVQRTLRQLHEVHATAARLDGLWAAWGRGGVGGAVADIMAVERACRGEWVKLPTVWGSVKLALCCD